MRGWRGAGGDGGLLHPSTDPLILPVLVSSPVGFFSCYKCRHMFSHISALETQLQSLFLIIWTLHLTQLMIILHAILEILSFSGVR